MTAKRESRHYVLNLICFICTILIFIPAAVFSQTAGTFASTGPMTDTRSYQTATLLPNGKVLIAGGYNIASLSSAELYDPVTGTFTLTGPMTAARSYHTATLLPNGKVLIAGGYDGSNTLSTGELYDPATGTFASTGSMTSARFNHTATLLPNGKVLIAGGYNDIFLSSAELYDPAAGTFASTGPMTAARRFHTATLLPIGKVLMAGGSNGSALSTAELYDPAGGTFASTGALTAARYSHRAALLPDGKVLISGGYDNVAYLSSAELYAPATGTFASTGPMTAARFNHTAMLLPNGKVFITGGFSGSYLSSAELYDPATGTFASTGPMGAARYLHTATLLPNGKVLIAGGYNGSNALSAAELYCPAGSNGIFGPTDSMSTSRRFHTATLLPDGKVLIAGGFNGAYLSTAELYDPATGTFASTGSMTTMRSYHTATLLPNGKVLIAGGHNGSAILLTAELYDPVTGTFASTGSMGAVRNLHTATLLPNGKVLIAGGNKSSTITLSTAELYDPADGTFAPTGSMGTARKYHTATLLPNGKVLITGGLNGITTLSTAELYDPAVGTFASTGSMTFGRYYHTAMLLPNGKVLIAGGYKTTSLSTAELYDPLTGTFASTGSMGAARNLHTATLLQNGKVLIAGGDNGSTTLSTAELYDPATGTFASTGLLSAARRFHTATLVPNGNVLTAGGYNGSATLSTAELYHSTNCEAMPDIIVQSILAEPNPLGQNVNVTVSVNNQGTAGAASFYVDFYKDLTTLPVQGQVGDQRCNISSLAAGATTTCDVTVSYSSAGTYNMYAQVDTGNSVTEVDEINNAYGPQPVTVCQGEIYYRDADGDGYGDPNNNIQACSLPSGFVADNTDCNDADDKSNPAAAEMCDNSDNDCDGQVDETLTRPTSCGIEGCASTGIETCSAGVWGGDTCIPGVPSSEICNNADDDCDGSIDENLTRPTTCGVSACASSGFETCTVGLWGGNTCTPVLPVTEGPAGDYKCSDTVDNDCDGALDGMDGGCVTPSSETYGFERLFPTLQQPWYFTEPGGIAVDRSGYVYLASAFYIEKYTLDGQLVTKWGGAGQEDGKFLSPKGIAVDSSGFIYVADSQNNRIQKFNSNGVYETQWGGEGFEEGKFGSPYGVAADNSGSIYVTDTLNNRIQKFDSNGRFIHMWGWGVATGTSTFETCTVSCLPGINGSGDGQFNSPAGITVDGSGFIYVTDTANYRIQKFTNDGVFTGKWGSYGAENGQFSYPSGIAIDDDAGYVYVADNGNSVIQIFNLNGEYQSGWGLGYPEAVAVDSSGIVYVTEAAAHRIRKFTPYGDLMATWGSSGTEDGQFSNPYGITVDGSGSIYVADTQNNRIQKFSSHGEYETQWGGEGFEEGKFGSPYGVAADNSGSIYVTDTLNNRIQKFDGNGTFIHMWGWGVATGTSTFETCTVSCLPGINGSGDGQFNSPAGITVDGSGFIYVVDSANHRIQKFFTNGQFAGGFGSYCDLASGDGCNTNAPGAYVSGDGQFNSPEGIAVDSSGFVYVADSGNYRIQKFTYDGVFVVRWGNDGMFNWPRGITADNSGFIYVTDTHNDRIQKFTADGLYLSTFGGSGSGPGMFYWPFSLFAKGDRIYITDTWNNRIQVIKTVSVASNNKAIIVAGGGPYAGNRLWPASQTAADFAYTTLTYQGLTGDRIEYLSSDVTLDLDNDGTPDIDSDATIAGLQDAISRASGADNLFVYLVDHGGSGTLRMNTTETLSASQLDSWLDAVQASISGKVVVIYDASESGSFLSALAGNNRILVTSTSTGESSYFVNQGRVSFSSFFWENVFNGSNVKDAFDNARSALTTAINNQTPQLEDGNSGTLAQNTYIGNGTIIYGNVPTIGSVSATVPAQSSAVLTANNVTDSDGIARVWAVILPPGYASGASNNSVIGLPSIDLMPTATEGQYQATYDKFNIAGTYRIAIYAKDRTGNTSMPLTTTVSAGSPLRKRAIIVAGDGDADVGWSAIEKGAVAAYNALKFQKYPDNDIYFVSPVGLTGVDGPPSLPYLESEINGMSGSSTYDLVMYMVGNGDAGTFKISSTETLSAAQLDGWLDSLQGRINGNVTVVYDASYAGAFNSALAGPNRILLGSSGGHAYFLSDGDISFSNYFWKRILNGQNVRDAFSHAGSAMEFSTNYVQTALIDDNGNGICNERGDGMAAADYTIGVGIRLAGNDPLIGPVSAIPDRLYGELSTSIRADDVTTVGTLAAVAPVWAVVTAPQGPGEESAVQTTVQMSDMGNNRFEGATGNIFTASGRYEVTVYAKDDAGNMSEVSHTTVSQLGLIDRYEDDDTYQQANAIFLDYPFAQQHNFDVSADEDWVEFYGVADTYYTFRATNLGTNSDVKFELYDEAGVTAVPQTPIALWDSDVYVYQVTQDGMYYLKATNFPQTVFGDDTGYDLEVNIEGGGTELPGTIKGYVYASGTSPAVPIEGAIIQTGDGRTATSQSNGYYYIGNHSTGSWSISVAKTGYNPGSSSVSVLSLILADKDLYMVSQCTPGAEVCDDIDNDCDGLMDDNDPGVTGQGTWHPDADSDTYGNTSVSLSRCIQPAGYVSDNTDCDDSDQYIYPDGPEVRIVDAPTSYYWIYELQTAYNDAQDLETIQGKVKTYTGNLVINQNKTIMIEGGYTGANNCGFTSMTGKTTVNGNVIISNGTVKILSGTLELK